MAGNLAEMETKLVRCDEGVLLHHCVHNDFSRWIADVFNQKALAASLSAVETRLAEQKPGSRRRGADGTHRTHAKRDLIFDS